VAVNLAPPEELLAVPGLRLASGAAAIKRSGRDDLALLVLDAGSQCAGVFTRNAFAAPPVQLARERLAGGGAGVRALIINSGNANAATGEGGLADARALCASVAEHGGFEAEQVLPFSTGVIGERLPLVRMQARVPELVAGLQGGRWLDAARAIMTTDTVPKAASRRIDAGGRTLTVTGMAKGSGMIRPDMATMLAFIACDAPVERSVAEALVREIADASFNRITVDGDTSTNDALMLLCSGAAAGSGGAWQPGSAEFAALRAVLMELAADLAQRVVRDGEGATRFVTVRVEGGRNASECLAVAYSIAESPLVKTALFAGDPNWGRFCMAIGQAGVPELDPAGVALYFDDLCVARNGMLDAAYQEAAAAEILARSEYRITVDLGRGTAAETLWTTDLSYDYVRINAEYRS